MLFVFNCKMSHQFNNIILKQKIILNVHFYLLTIVVYIYSYYYKTYFLIYYI